MDKKQSGMNCDFSDRRTSKHFDASGANFCKYYKRSPTPPYKKTAVPTNAEEIIKVDTCHSNRNCNGPFQHKETLTMYRESQAQTDPWDPPFKIEKKFKDPDMLDLRYLKYGNGLPAGILEVEEISNARKLKDLDAKFISDKNDEQYKSKKQVIQEQVKSQWNNRVAVLNQAQQQKLALMQSNTVDDLKRYHMKKECILKNLWNTKKMELYETHLQLENKLQKKLNVLDRNFQTQTHLQGTVRKNSSSKASQQPETTKEIDYVLKNHYLSNTFGTTSKVKDWLEEGSCSLTCNILPRGSSTTKKVVLSNQDLQKFFEKKKKVKHSAVIENEGFGIEEEEENASIPTHKPEIVLEPLVVEKKKVNLVTMLQQVLRGLACQKQMLDLIERHRDGLNTVLEPLYPGIADS